MADEEMKDEETTEEPGEDSEASAVAESEEGGDVEAQSWFPDPFGSFGFPSMESFWPRLRARRQENPLFGPGETMRMEQFREGDEFVVRAELPGIDPEEEVEISVDRGALRITARRERREEVKDDNTYRSEFSYGTLQRSVMLPEGTDEDAITASYDDGILEIRAPVTDEGPRRTIPVSR